MKPLERLWWSRWLPEIEELAWELHGPSIVIRSTTKTGKAAITVWTRDHGVFDTLHSADGRKRHQQSLSGAVTFIKMALRGHDRILE